MKAEDFMINNLILCHLFDRDGLHVCKINLISAGNDEIGQVPKLDVESIEFSDEGGNPYIEDIKPITLTEEWLLKLGFVFEKWPLRQSPDQKGWHVPGETFTVYKSKSSDLLYIYYQLKPIWVKHVHQLQNVYFLLTGTNLKLKKDEDN